MMYLGTEIFRPSARSVPVVGRTDRAAPDPSAACISEILRLSVLSIPVSRSESGGTPSHSAVTRTLLGFEGEIATRYRTEGAEPQPVRRPARSRNVGGERQERAGMDMEINAVDRRCHRPTLRFRLVAADRFASSRKHARSATTFEAHIARGAELARPVGAVPLCSFRGGDSNARERRIVGTCRHRLRPGRDKHADKRYRGHKDQSECREL